MVKKHLKRARQEAIKIKKRVIEKLNVLITAAFGFVAALAWNAAIQDTIKRQDWLQQYGSVVYALIVTVIAVIITVWLSYISERLK